MLTVREFKDFGVEFVIGDERSSSVIGHGDTYMSEDMAYGSNHECKTDHELIRSFAWRPLNTLSDSPKFKYEVDIDAHSWRPLLEQSAKPNDDNPVFTQEMADDCMPLLAGMMFESECGQYEALMVNKKSVCFEDENGWLVTMPIGKVKPVRTPKQKAIDNIAKMLHSEGVVMFDPIMLHIMYEKGFIKTDKEA
jgi:hypothetical protein